MLNVRKIQGICVNSCQTCERKFFQMNPAWRKYYLNNLPGKLDGAHFMIFHSKSPTGCLISCGAKLQILILIGIEF